MKPLISVIVPTHNRVQLLEEALASLETQVFCDWEAIVVDDASAPEVDSERIVAEYPRSRLIRHKSVQGGAAAKNTGVRAARGEFLAFLDDDDLYDPRYLSRALEVLDRQSDIEVLFMGVRWFGRDAQLSERAHAESLARTLECAPGHPVEQSVVRWYDQNLLRALLQQVPMPFQRPVVRRTAFDRIGEYRPNCLLWDCEWALRASILTRAAFLNESLYAQRADRQGTSSLSDRKSDHIESAVEMVLNLYHHMPEPQSTETRRLLRQAAGRNKEHLAYYLSEQGDLSGALGAWWEAQSIDPSLARCRFPIAAIARSVIDKFKG